ncbi:unnamed protein product [Haemonchus placei]|uniref:FHA domain-containing protein n=1 Tax=Haemonchus placei TaxID=6290 RepID=A0A0N4W4H9_HAEPC|nr:unnamed protein product [Haemonchus placei]
MTGETSTVPAVRAVATTAAVDEKSKFVVPDWASRPPPGSHLDVCKGDQLIQKLMVDEKRAYYFGRNPKQVDFAVEHASCSRVHALLLYHGVLNRFALVDMESIKNQFVLVYRLRQASSLFVDHGNFLNISDCKRCLIKYSCNVTEYNTALNRRIPQLPISVEEARRKKRPRGNVAFIEQEEIINPEDVDPSIGRFRNLVATAIISNNPAKRTAPEVKGHEPPRKIVRPFRDVSLAAPMCSTLGGMALNAAPDLELYSKTLPEPGMHNSDDEPHKKKYAKESWPGRKPMSGIL